MAYHFIAIASYYAGGTRIGWHYASNENLDKTIIQEFLAESNERLGTSEYGIHKLVTDDLSWESVVKKDSFFSDIMVGEDKEAFFSMLENDREISVIDIAKFFLSVGPLTNLKLQKLIYFAYATHLTKTGKKLFSEPIVAYKYGPVIEDVYQLYKGYGRDEIEQENGPEFWIENLSFPVSFTKIALNESGDTIFYTLLEVLKEYWPLSTSRLVDISHTADGPWDHVFEEGCYRSEITDDLIEKYHHKERERVAIDNKVK